MTVVIINNKQQEELVNRFLIQDISSGLFFSYRSLCDEPYPARAWQFRYERDARTTADQHGWEVDENFHEEFPDYGL